MVNISNSTNFAEAENRGSSAKFVESTADSFAVADSSVTAGGTADSSVTAGVTADSFAVADSFVTVGGSAEFVENSDKQCYSVDNDHRCFMRYASFGDNAEGVC